MPLENLLIIYAVMPKIILLVKGFLIHDTIHPLRPDASQSIA